MILIVAQGNFSNTKTEANLLHCLVSNMTYLHTFDIWLQWFFLQGWFFCFHQDFIFSIRRQTEHSCCLTILLLRAYSAFDDPLSSSASQFLRIFTVETRKLRNLNFSSWVLIRLGLFHRGNTNSSDCVLFLLCEYSTWHKKTGNGAYCCSADIGMLFRLIFWQTMTWKFHISKQWMN